MKSQQVLTLKKNFLLYFYRRLLNFCLNFNTLLTFADFFADFFKNRSGSPGFDAKNKYCEKIILGMRFY
jgi:hypothetical protein